MNRLYYMLLLALACVAAVHGEVAEVDDLPPPTTIFWTAPPGEAPIVINSVGFTPGSVSPFTTQSPTPSGPFLPGGVIAALILGIIGIWLCCLLICFVIILAIFMSGGGDGRFDSTVRSHTADAVDSDMGSTTSHSVGDNKTTIEFTDLNS
eukprot:TRINITY_DN1687_c0_g1_i3.p2 TRINITY_DN1687_c0_g1~~TRINITY_DN1687_c0_g1_i3.p2  ORF type:complete len:151 (-),score=46.83 TRINITY_DN1687_c0_g1_i3:380-832(-)